MDTLLVKFRLFPQICFKRTAEIVYMETTKEISTRLSKGSKTLPDGVEVKCGNGSLERKGFIYRSTRWTNDEIKSFLNNKKRMDVFVLAASTH